MMMGSRRGASVATVKGRDPGTPCLRAGSAKSESKSASASREEEDWEAQRVQNELEGVCELLLT